jgi:exodeoxyribonuclease VII large subunit
MENSLFEQPKSRIFTVSQITSLIKTSLENSLPGRVTITGEISGFKRHSSGHCYFDLKDENAVLPCVMWGSDFTKLKFKPENGLAVVAKGHIDVYPPQGKYQFYADSMIPAGMGALQLAFEQMKKRLEAEGLFRDEHKKPLPKFPFRIGILTSKSGAALHDIIDSIYNRWPVANLLFYDVPVQGEGAAEKIAAAIKDVNRRNAVLKLDVMIVGRGGGSMEDLWAFNEEIVARAIFASEIPVISAVGHEVDWTIADYVADARASTPTKAGMIAVPDIKEVLQQIDSAGKRIGQDTESILKLSAQRLKTILAAAVFRSPALIVRNREQFLDELENNLPQKAGRLLSAVKLQIETLAAKLVACNPKSVLNRGYSIAKNAITGKVVTSAADVSIGDIMITELANENSIESKVIKK